MNRYEEILTRFVAARIAYGGDPDFADDFAQLRRAAANLEAHFEERDAVGLERNWRSDVPALLRRQAE